MKIEIDKPVVPQFVADWVEEQKEDCDDVAWENNSIYNIVDNLRHDVRRGFVNKKLGEWLYSDIKNEIALEKAIILSYGVEQEPLYYAKNKLTGQYLGNKDIGIGSCILKPFWLFGTEHMQVEKLTKEKYKVLYGLDDTNTIFEEV